MTKTLLLLRHAKSSWENPSLNDHERPLNERGLKAAKQIGRRLRTAEIEIDQVLCSTSVRTKETAALVFAELIEAPQISFHADLYHAAPEQIVQILKQLPETTKTAMVIGHNPGFEEFLKQLSGESQSFPTAALADMEIDLDRWNSFDRQTRGRLRRMWRPKELDRE